MYFVIFSTNSRQSLKVGTIRYDTSQWCTCMQSIKYMGELLHWFSVCCCSSHVRVPVTLGQQKQLDMHVLFQTKFSAAARWEDFICGWWIAWSNALQVRYPAILVTSAVVVLSNAKLSPTQLAHGGKWCGISYTQIEYRTENSGALLSQLGMKQLWLQQLYFVAKCMHGWDSYSYDKWVTSIVLRYAQNHWYSREFAFQPLCN